MVFLLIVILVIVASLSRKAEGSWLAPAPFFSLFWASYVAVSTLFSTEPDALTLGVLWIVVSCICVVIGSLAARGFESRNIRRPTMIQPAYWRFGRLKLVSAILSVLGIALIGYLFLRSGVSISAAFSFESSTDVSATNRADYTYGDMSQSAAEWCIYVLLYFNAFLGGMIARLARRNSERILGVAPVFLVAYALTLYGSRMGVLWGGSFWISSLIAAHVLAVGTRRTGDTKFLLRIGLYSFGILVGMSVITMAVRYHGIDAGRSLHRHLTETFCFIPAFCLWFKSDGLDVTELMWGFRMFTKTYELFGIHNEWEQVILVEATSSNVFTVFRGLIDDFGHLGSCVFLGVGGLSASYSYRRVMEGRASFFPALAIVFAYTFVGTSCSVFMYNAPNLAIMLFFGYFGLRQIMFKGRLPHGSPIGGRASAHFVSAHSHLDVHAKRSGDVAAAVRRRAG